MAPGRRSNPEFRKANGRLPSFSGPNLSRKGGPETMQIREMRARRRLLKTQLRLMLTLLGPGIITAFGGNDASGIYGYSLAGVQYGYALLWVLVLLVISLGVCQEMCARMGAVTGKGLADLIREEYGVKVALF